MKNTSLLLAIWPLFIAPLGFAQDLDLVVAAPRHTKVLAENDKVRVLEFTAKAGDKIPLHSHPDTVVYVLKSGKRRLSSPDGNVVDSNPEAGSAIIRSGTTHSEEVLEDFKAILVEIKK